MLCGKTKRREILVRNYRLIIVRSIRDENNILAWNSHKNDV